ncbi:unnamed protein product, partial [Scytosiphon promiscuus]
PQTPISLDALRTGPPTMVPTDRDALVALYHATDGPNWKNSSNWNSDADLSEWHGVILNGQGRVVGLSLSFNQLRGTVLD